MQSHSYGENKNFIATRFLVMPAMLQENKLRDPQRVARICVSAHTHHTHTHLYICVCVDIVPLYIYIVNIYICR